MSEIEFHGATSTGNIPGYSAFSGSFEYVRKRGADTVYDALVTARRAGSILEFRFMNDDNATSGAKGVQAPVLLGETSLTANGGDGVVDSFTFGKADAFDASGDAVEVTDVAIT